MSTRRVQSSAIKPRTLGAAAAVTPWVRNPSWLGPTTSPAFNAVSDSEQRFRGLVAVFPQGTYVALNATTSSGTYTVDWGDGSSENVASNTQANKFIDFNDADLAGTNAPVKLTDSGDLVERVDKNNNDIAHGYSNGMEVRFYNIVSTTGLSAAQVYYVINATANNFQVSTTVGGGAVALTTNGTATLLPYKQAIVNVTPTTANLSTFNLNVKNTTSGLQAYETGWLDIEFSGPNLTASGLTLGGTNVRFAMCERAALRHIGNCTSFSNLFSNFRVLKEVVITASTSAVTNMTSMFINCTSLETAPLFNTAAVTSMTNAFNTCNSLVTVPLLNTASVQFMEGMFSSCNSLVTVPLFNTAAVINMFNTFNGCRSLTTVPAFNLASVAGTTGVHSMFANCISLVSVPLFNINTTAGIGLTMNSMFNGCSSLNSVPLFNTAQVTNMNNLFAGCLNLERVPLFNTEKVVSMNSMFNGCVSLTSIPLFNTPLLTDIGSIFVNCVSLTEVPLLNTASVTIANSIFSSCNSLTSVPALNVSAVSSASNINGVFGNCTSLARIEAKDFKFTFSVGFCRLGKTELEEIFTNLPTVATSQTITISSNVGLGTSVTTRSTTTTAQSTTSTISNTTSLATGMLVIGTGTGITTGITVTSNVSADTLTLTSHGLPDGTPIAFSSLGTTTGVSLWTIYYVRDTTANTFKIAATAGGAALDLTGTGGSMVVRYANYITGITANTSITTDTPMASSGTNNLDYRTINTASALLKNWAVTY